MSLFTDRAEAGRKLAEAIGQVSKNAIVLAIPRGGVVVGYQIAQSLHIPLDIVITKKIGAPNNPEFAIGAVAEDGAFLPDQSVINMLGISESYILKELERQKQEIKRRIQHYRGDAPLPLLKGREIILVDDGVATGSTLKVALRFLKRQAKTIIVAVPVGPVDTIRSLEQEANKVVCLAMPEPFYAIGEFYEDFQQTSDEEVIQLLSQNKKNLKK